jgi:hypothetical protein
MVRLIRRRLVALAIAYAVALAPIVPLLAAYADPSQLGEICGADHVRTGADGPIGHVPVCPMCLAHDCGAPGLLATDASGSAVPAVDTDRSLAVARADDLAPGPRRAGRQLARAPPRA